MVEPAEEFWRPNELEDEARRPQKLLAEADLDQAILRDAWEGNY